MNLAKSILKKGSYLTLIIFTSVNAAEPENKVCALYQRLLIESASRGTFRPFDLVALEPKSLSRRDRKLHKRMLKVQEAFVKEGSITPAQLEDFVLAASELSYPERRGRFFQGSLVTAEQKRAAILEAAVAQLSQKNLIQALDDWGLLGDPSLKRQFLDEAKSLGKFLSGAIDVAFIAHGQLPPLAPRIGLMKHVEIPTEIMNKIFSEGLDAAYPDLKSLYGARVNFDLHWPTIRRAYYLIILGMVTIAGAKALEAFLDQIESKKNQLQSDLRKADKTLKGELSLKEITVESLFQNFVKTYRVDNQGRDPSAEDQAAVRAELENRFK